MPARILVADDDPQARYLLGTALRKRNYQVVVARDGDEALRHLGAGTFNVLIADLQMPDISGQTLMARAREQAPDMGLIVVTAFKTLESVVSGFRRGLHAYLPKPVDLFELYGAVEASVRLQWEVPDSADFTLTADTEGRMEFTAPSHVLFVERFENLFRRLYEDSVDEQDMSDLRIAINELGGNAVEWGNRLDLRKPVSISVQREADLLILTFRDQGPGFQMDEVPDPVHDPVATALARREDGKRPGGYGIALVRRVVDQLTYNEAGNTVTIVKRLRPPPVVPVGATPPFLQKGLACDGPHVDHH